MEEINWLELEKEWRDIHNGLLIVDNERIDELKSLALENNRELVSSGSQAWMVEYEGE